MNRLLLSLPLSLLLSLALITPAYAHPWIFHHHARAQTESTTDKNTAAGSTSDVKQRGAEIKTKIDEFKAAARDKQLTIGKDVCTKMADQRIKAIEAVKSRTSASDLTQDQKNEILTAANSALTDLTTSKTDCSKATTVDGARTAVNKIKDKHVFKWILQRSHALRGIHRAQAFIGRLNNHTATIQKHIDSAKEKGCDVTRAEAALADYKAAVEEAQTNLTESKDVVVSVGEAADPGETKREQVKTEMKAMVDALHKARDAHKKIIVELKECRTSTGPNTSTPSITPDTLTQ